LKKLLSFTAKFIAAPGLCFLVEALPHGEQEDKKTK